MKSVSSTAFATLVAVSLIVPTLSSPAEARRGRGAAIGLGVGLGILGAAAIAGSSRRSYADDYEYGYRPVYRNQCGKWDYQCSRGSGWACRKFENNC